MNLQKGKSVQFLQFYMGDVYRSFLGIFSKCFEESGTRIQEVFAGETENW